MRNAEFGLRNKKRIDWDADERRFSGCDQAKKICDDYLSRFTKRDFHNLLNVGAVTPLV
jgi:hypothetical protein